MRTKQRVVLKVPRLDKAQVRGCRSRLVIRKARLGEDAPNYSQTGGYALQPGTSGKKRWHGTQPKPVAPIKPSVAPAAATPWVRQQAPLPAVLGAAGAAGANYLGHHPQNPAHLGFTHEAPALGAKTLAQRLGQIGHRNVAVQPSPGGGRQVFSQYGGQGYRMDVHPATQANAPVAQVASPRASVPKAKNAGVARPVTAPEKAAAPPAAKPDAWARIDNPAIRRAAKSQAPDLHPIESRSSNQAREHHLLDLSDDGALAGRVRDHLAQHTGQNDVRDVGTVQQTMDGRSVIPVTMQNGTKHELHIHHPKSRDFERHTEHLKAEIGEVETHPEKRLTGAEYQQVMKLLPRAWGEGKKLNATEKARFDALWDRQHRHGDIPEEEEERGHPLDKVDWGGLHDSPDNRKLVDAEFSTMNRAFPELMHQMRGEELRVEFTGPIVEQNREWVRANYQSGTRRMRIGPGYTNTVAHESGHWVDDVLGISNDPRWQKFCRSLVRQGLWDKIFGDSGDADDTPDPSCLIPDDDEPGDSEAWERWNKEQTAGGDALEKWGHKFQGGESDPEKIIGPFWQSLSTAARRSPQKARQELAEIGAHKDVQWSPQELEAVQRGIGEWVSYLSGPRKPDPFHAKVRSLRQHGRRYWSAPEEIFARLFDQQCHHKSPGGGRNAQDGWWIKDKGKFNRVMTEADEVIKQITGRTLKSLVANMGLLKSQNPRRRFRLVLRKSWSGDMTSECSQRFGGDCHWITLHSRAGQDGAHVLVSPPQGARVGTYHSRIVWAPEGSGLEHLRLQPHEHPDEDETEAAYRQAAEAARKAQAAAPKEQLNPAQQREVRERAKYRKQKDQDALQSHLNRLAELIPSFKPEAEALALRQAQKIAALGQTKEDHPEEPGAEGQSAGPGGHRSPTEGDAKSEGATADEAAETPAQAKQAKKQEREAKRAAKQEDKDQAHRLKAVTEAVRRMAVRALDQHGSGGESPAPRDLSQIKDLQQRADLEHMSDDVAREVLYSTGKLEDARKQTKKVARGQVTAQGAEEYFATHSDPKEWEDTVSKRLADRERVNLNAALWQKVGQNTKSGRAFQQGGVEALSAITSKALGASVSPTVIGALGVAGTAQVIASELARTGSNGKNQVKPADVIRYIESQADTLRAKDKDGKPVGVLAEVAEKEDQMRQNHDMLESGDLDINTVDALNTRLNNEAQSLLGGVAGRLEAGAELAKHLRAAKPGDLTLIGGLDPEHILEEMDLLGLKDSDYSLARRQGQDEKGQARDEYDVTIKASAFPKIVNQFKQDHTSDAIRQGKLAGQYQHPQGWTTEKENGQPLQLDPPRVDAKGQVVKDAQGQPVRPVEQRAAVQFFLHNKRVLIDASTGHGKTPTSAAAALEVANQVRQEKGRAARILVLTTGGVRAQYGQELNRFAPGLKVKVADGTTAENEASIRNAGKGDRNQEQTVTVCAHNALVHNPQAILGQKWDAIIVDEADKCVSPEKKGESATAETFEKLAGAADKILCATATPMRNRPLEYWKMLHLLRPQRFPSYQNFASRYENLGQGSRAYDDAISESLNNETKDTVYSVRLHEGDRHEDQGTEVVPVMDHEAWRARHAQVEREYGADKSSGDAERMKCAEGKRDMQHQIVSYDIDRNNPVQQRARATADEAYAKRGEKGVVFANYLEILNTFKQSYKEGEWLEYSGRENTGDDRRGELKTALNHEALVPGVRIQFTQNGKRQEGVIGTVHRGQDTTDRKGNKVPGPVLGYAVKVKGKHDETTGEALLRVGKQGVEGNVKSMLRGLLATSAGEYGLNLQHGARYVLELGHPWTPTAHEQRVGRLRSRIQSMLGRRTWNKTLLSDHPLAGQRRRNIFAGKAGQVKGRELGIAQQRRASAP